MDVNSAITLAGFLLTVVIQLMTLAYYSGKATRGQEALQAQITMSESERRKYQVDTDERLNKLEEKHDSRYLAVDREMIKVSANMGNFEKELKELKETFKEFTKEIKELIQEVKRN